MTDTSLERRCQWVARAYAEPGRRDEVVTTLMESNAGRRSPRASEAANVLWHGLATRLRQPVSPGTRYGRFGDLFAVLVVGSVVALAATAVVVLSLAAMSPRVGYVTRPAHPFGTREVVAGAAATVVALAAAWFATRGRLWATRALVVVAGFAGLGVYAVERSLGESLSFRSDEGIALVGAALAVVLAVLFTTAVARSARVVVASWWWTVFGVSVLAGRYAIDANLRPFGYGRAAEGLAVLVATAIVGTVLVLPLVFAPRPVVATD